MNPPVLYFGDLNEKHNINPKQPADFNTRGRNSTQLKNSYNELIKLEDIDDDIFPFKLLLLASDDEEILEFHLKILSENSDEYLRRDLFVFSFDRKDMNFVGEFLYKKYREGIKDLAVGTDIIEILGHLRSQYGKILALQNISKANRDLRYRSIIVLGWVGDQEDIAILSERLLSDNDVQLRGYAATAMRQI